MKNYVKITQPIIDLTLEMAKIKYEKNSEEIFNILLEKIWKLKEEEFGYIYNNDPHETKDTYPELLKLHYCIDQKKKVEDINFDVIPKRYNKLIEIYNKL